MLEVENRGVVSETKPHHDRKKRKQQMKIQVLFAALHIGFAGLMSWAVICPVYAQGGQVREIGQPPTGGSSDTALQNASKVQLPIRITEPGNYRLNTNLVGITPNTVISIESSDVTLDLNGFSISGGGPGILGSGQNIAISNGSIVSGDGDAIRLFGLSNSNCSIERLRIGGRDGIVLTGTDETEGTNCIVKNNTVNVARFGILCSGCVVSGNTVTAATNPIFASNSSLVVGNRAMGNVALRADDTTGYAQNVLHGTTADVTGGVQIGENLCVTSKICPP
jgi:hypothetical protein